MIAQQLYILLYYYQHITTPMPPGKFSLSTLSFCVWLHCNYVYYYQQLYIFLPTFIIIYCYPQLCILLPAYYYTHASREVFIIYFIFLCMVALQLCILLPAIVYISTHIYNYILLPTIMYITTRILLHPCLQGSFIITPDTSPGKFSVHVCMCATVL